MGRKTTNKKKTKKLSLKDRKIDLRSKTKLVQLFRPEALRRLQNDYFTGKLMVVWRDGIIKMVDISNTLRVKEPFGFFDFLDSDDDDDDKDWEDDF